MLYLFPEIERHGIDYVDVGCSAQIDAKWRSIGRLLNYTGFDPNEAECQRLASISSPFKSVRYIPCAIGGSNGPAILNLTQSLYCSSLLKPRHEWLRRFSFHDLFVETGTESVTCFTLDQLAEGQELRADVLKLDTQGLELPILAAASKLLATAVCVETETGFVENYVGESVMAAVDVFMREQGFLLFDLVSHRVGRANALARSARRQPLWCECTWMKDYLAERSWGKPVRTPDRLQAIKALFVCRTLGFYDYGLELANHFRRVDLLTKRELDALSSEDLWLGVQSKRVQLRRRLLGLFPVAWRFSLRDALDRTLSVQ